MTDNNTIIRIINEISHSDVADVNDLKREFKREDCVYSAQQFCDFRYATNLVRFRYDPYTGELINWKKVKELLTEE
jgi:hypothetical protein